MSKLITVFGATGLQGGSVIKRILADPALSKQFKIRGIARDVDKPASQALTAQGVEMASADLNSKESVAAVLKGTNTVFLVTNFWETSKASVEISQGKNVADAAKEAGVSHLIFSSLRNVTEMSSGKLKHVSHFDSKADVEQYIRDSGVPCTFVLPGYYMSNFEKFLRKSDNGVYTVALPIPSSAEFPLLDTKEDIGKFVSIALKNPDRWNGKRILAATDYYTGERILSDFEQATGHKTHYAQITAEQYKSYLPPQAAEEFLENHLLLKTPGYYGGDSLKPSLEALGSDKATTWEEFVKNSSAFA